MTVSTASPADRRRRPIELASHPRFRVGTIEVRPGVREVVGADGPERVEPRVMAVLIALADAVGETVSRDELIERCWGGVVVGEDAINRVIAKLRRLAAGAAAGSFAIDTVTKVGHRLVLRDPDGSTAVPPAEDAPPDAAARSVRRFHLIGWALAGIVVAVAAALLAWRQNSPVSPTSSVDPAATELIERGLSSVFEGTPEQAAQSVAYLREATALAPSSAEAWGGLALAYAQYLRRVPPADQAAVERRAQSAAQRALELRPAQSEALAALAEMQVAFRAWDRKDALQRRALAAAPDEVGLVFQRARFLLGVGRVDEGLPFATRGARLPPLGARIQAGLVEHLAAAGRIEEAERAAQRLGTVWPRYYGSWYLRFYMLSYLGRPREAQAMAADRPNWPDNIPAADIERAGLIARAIATRDTADADAVIAAFAPLVSQGTGYTEIAMRAAAAIGRRDDAFRFARALYLDEGVRMPSQRFAAQANYGPAGERQTQALFTPPFASLRRDPRYLGLMADIGLVDYWRRSNTPPDFCLEAAMRDACAARGIPVRR